VGIAKPHALKKAGHTKATDRIFAPQYKEALSLRDGHAGLRILQHARDEVHKHAITYHRKVRRKSTLSSLLEGIDGVGPGRRKALLQHFGSAKAVATASVQELCQAPGVGPALAQTIHQSFRRRPLSL
jgi:excinuclease ABC subunit C